MRQSGGKKSKDLQITKEGSGLLRWALVESAWRLVNTSPKWTAVFSRLRKRKRRRKAGHRGGGRKLLCVLYAMLKTIDTVQRIDAHHNRPARAASDPKDGKQEPNRTQSL